MIDIDSKNIHTTLKYKKSLNQDNISVVYNPFETAKGQVNLRAITKFLPFSQNYDFRKTFILALQIAMHLLMIAP